MQTAFHRYFVSDLRTTFPTYADLRIVERCLSKGRRTLCPLDHSSASGSLANQDMAHVYSDSSSAPSYSNSLQGSSTYQYLSPVAHYYSLQ